jgi:hypothetical protein
MQRKERKYLTAFNEANVAVSLITGFNIYTETKKTIKLPTENEAYVLRHEQSREYYYAVRLRHDYMADTEDALKNKWENLIKRPCSSLFMWPVDIVKMGNEYFLIFDTVPDEGYVSLYRVFDREAFPTIPEITMTRIIRSYVDAYQYLTEKSYLFLGIDEKNILIDTVSGNLLMSANGLVYRNRYKNILYRKKDYFSPGTDPYSHMNRSKDVFSSDNDVYMYDSLSQEYAFASLLFRMMVGCYPYDGPYMSGYDKNRPDNDWINRYLQKPVFIFDTKDNSNSVVPLRYYRKYVEKWQSLSAELRIMFGITLNESRVMRKNVTKSYPAAKWKKAVDKQFNT